MLNITRMYICFVEVSMFSYAYQNIYLGTMPALALEAISMIPQVLIHNINTSSQQNPKMKLYKKILLEA